ncbi:hypothetical protein ACODYM_28715 [Burkholderia gladioli]|uniref:hypothetical protein n=1 Tax=Burkholderia gladioli TaxID=28095 RepID=UPI003B50EF1D
MQVELHKLNGLVVGAFYTLDDGRALYLAHRQNRDMLREKAAWCFDNTLLRRVKERGIEAIGVMTKTGGRRSVWLTHIDDFTDSPFSFRHNGATRQRGLPSQKFRVRPETRPERIAKAMRIR